jgi:hypothetical protein
VIAIATGFAHTLALLAPQPSIALLNARVTGNVAVLKVRITNWRMYPDLVGKKLNKPDGGHWRIVVDGKSNSLSTSLIIGKTAKLRPGKHRIWVRLENNDGSKVAETRPSKTQVLTVKGSS